MEKTPVMTHKQSKIVSSVRKHVKMLNDRGVQTQTPLSDSCNMDVDEDDFVLYIDTNLDIQYGSVVFPITELIDPETTSRRWLAFIIKDKPYLVSRQECMSYKNINDCVIIDPTRIMNIPMGPTVIASATIVTTTANNLSVSRNQLKTSSTTIGSNREERTDEEILHKMRIKYSINRLLVQPYSLYYPMSDLPYYDNDDVIAYAKQVCDYALITRHFKSDVHRLLLYNKLIVNYNQSPIVEKGHGPMIRFMCLMISESESFAPTYFESTDIKYQHISRVSCPMLDMCVAWEVLKLRRSGLTGPELDNYQTMVDGYIALSDEFRLPEWTLYSVDQHSLFWRLTDDGNYAIRFEWLSKMTNTLPRRNIKEGLITLTRIEFYDVFLPLFYTQLLTDTFRFIIMSNSRIPPQPSEETILKPLPSTDVCKTNERWLINYVHEHLNPTSFVLRKIKQRDSHINNNKTSYLPPKSTLPISQLVDIEDLHDYLPPCLKPVLKKGVHLKNDDRRLMVNYLVDMQYPLEDALELLSKCDAGDVTNLYNASKKKNYDSFYCGGIINIDANRFGTTTRCKYEQSCNGEKRRNNHSDDEKFSFRRQCTASLNIGSIQAIKHPSDYIRHKLESKKEVCLK